MSRTKRHIPKRANGRTPFLRRPKTKTIQVAEHYAALEIEQAGFEVHTRAKARGNPGSRKIPTVRDDIHIAALFETDHHK